MRNVFIILGGLLFQATLLQAQPEGLSNLRTTLVEVRYTFQPLDSLPVLPSSVQAVFADTVFLSPSCFEIRDRAIRFLPSCPLSEGTAVEVRYRVLPWDLSAPLSRLALGQASDGAAGGLPQLEYNPYADEGSLLPSYQGLDYNGSFARGISFGSGIVRRERGDDRVAPAPCGSGTDTAR